MPKGNSDLTLAAAAAARDTKQDQKLPSGTPATLMSAAATPATQIFDLQAQLNALKTDIKLTTLDLSQYRTFDEVIVDKEARFVSSGFSSLLGLPDGRLAAVSISGKRDDKFKYRTYRKLYLLDPKTGSEQILQPYEEENILGNNTESCSLIVLPDGRLVSAWKGEIRFWNLNTGNCEMKLRAHPSRIHGFAVLSDGRLASKGEKTVKIWDTKTYKCVQSFTFSSWWRDKLNVNAMVALPNNQLAIPHNETIKIWDIKTGKCLHTLEGHTSCVMSLLLYPDGRLISSTSYGNPSELKVWDLKTNQCVTTESGIEAKSMIMLKDGTLVLSSPLKPHSLWVPKTKQNRYRFGLRQMHSHGEQKMSGDDALAVFPDGRLAIGERNTIRFCNPTIPAAFLTWSDIEPLLASLPHSAVTILNLQNCALTDQNIPKLVAYLQNTKLTSLDVRQTLITAKGAKALEDGLKTHATLKQILPTSGSMEKEQGARNFAIMLDRANRGDVNAQSLVGEAYLGGIGVGQNLAQAVHWLNMAAGKNIADAQNNLGLCYENGWFVDIDFDMASKWYKCAVAQGHENARANLTRVQAKQKEHFEAVTKIASILAASMTQVLNSDQQPVTAAAGSAAIPPPSAPLYNFDSAQAGPANSQKETVPTNSM